MGPRRQGLTLVMRFLGRGRSRPAAIVLAVAWGTLSMMLLLAFGEGLRLQMEAGRLGLGPEPVMLWAGTTTKPWQGMKAGRRVRFLEEDLAALRREIPEIEEISGEYSDWGVDLAWGTKSVSSQVTGVTACFERIRSHHPQRGSRFINELDDAQARRVLFLGPELKTRLFGGAEAVGATVRLRGIPFTVVGVMVDKQQNGSYGGPDVNKASIPLKAFEAVFGARPYDNIVYTLRANVSHDEAERKIRQVFGRRQRFDPEDKSAIHVWNTARGRVEAEKIMKGIQIFLGMVGAMTLLVAGVGLANMLFVMVQRRTREIGTQMAIGARRETMTAQIVGESLILAGIGGYVGIGLAWAIVEIVQRIPVRSEGLQFLGKPTLSIPLGLVTALVLLGVGALSGTLPARRASRLNPVEALRHE